MKGVRETIDWSYTDPAALKIYADWLGISLEKAKRSRDGFFPKAGLDPDRIVGLDVIVKDAVDFKYTAALALEMGHTNGATIKHYRDLVKPKVAARYWNITPQSEENIVQLVAKA